MSKIRDKIKPLLTIIVPVALILLASAMITGCGEDPIPLAENTAESSAKIENTEPIVTEPPTPPPFDPKNVEIVENPTDSSMSSPLIYTTWEGLDFSNLLRYEIDYYKNQPDKYLAINVFRRNGDYFYTDYVYDGMTYKELENAILTASSKANLMQTLISKEGEILKYGKEIVTGKGVPTDDPLIDDFDKGVRWAESLYDKTVAKYDGMLSRYIVDGDFLSELAESDRVLFKEEYNALKGKMSEMSQYYFQRHEAGDLALFKSLGLNADEINGKLCIFVTFEQLRGLAGRADMQCALSIICALIS